jgi:regulator of replication initiation timing
MSQHDELKRLADAAKNWGGEVGKDQWYTAECFKQPHFSLPDAEFIAACDPGQVRALIAEHDQIKAEKELLLLAGESLTDQIKQLKAEIAGLKTGYQAYEQVNAELKAEVEKLRTALTYIRDTSDDWHVCEKAADALADAAMGKGEQS